MKRQNKKGTSKRKKKKLIEILSLLLGGNHLFYQINETKQPYVLECGVKQKSVLISVKAKIKEIISKKKKKFQSHFSLDHTILKMPEEIEVAPEYI